MYASHSYCQSVYRKVPSSMTSVAAVKRSERDSLETGNHSVHQSYKYKLD